ncbi:META domain-containing protein [Orbus wheelerorum]|uniref:META domain-containing protein n=1 Tax=Orbus wheelerorum TaxID=3074111 RepID=UPI00370D6FA9
MKCICYVLTLLISVITLSACDNKQSVTEQDLRHHRFVAIKLNNETINSNSQNFIEFGENFTINGKMCNAFSGQAALTNDTINVAHLISTEMLCSDEQQNQLDFVINQLLQHGATVILNKTADKQSLTLKNNENEIVFKLHDLM